MIHLPHFKPLVYDSYDDLYLLIHSQLLFWIQITYEKPHVVKLSLMWFFKFNLLLWRKKTLWPEPITSLIICFIWFSCTLMYFILPWKNTQISKTVKGGKNEAEHYHKNNILSIFEIISLIEQSSLWYIGKFTSLCSVGIMSLCWKLYVNWLQLWLDL